MDGVAPQTSPPEELPDQEQRRGNPVVAVLNDRWRVIDDPLQWILQVRKGRKRAKASGYTGSAYCASRTALIRNIRERCGDVDPAALQIIEALPARHVDRERKARRGD